LRFYENFREATSEIRRDLKEMGTRVHSKTYQDKSIEGDEGMVQRELQNYVYTVTKPELDQLDPTQPWADAEFAERVGGPVNPGEAYKLRPEVWNQFIQKDGRFGYSYPERMATLVEGVINTLKRDESSRQAYLSVCDPVDLHYTGGARRVPCTLGYQFQIRGGQLNVTYLMRSSDFATHFQNDLYLAHKLQRHVAEKLDVPVGFYSHFISSLHVFEKDVKAVF
jgi:thymidylate synthase